MAKLALCLVVQEIGGDGPVDPGYGVGGGAHPWFPGHIGGPRPGHGLPGSPGHPGNWVPGTPLPSHPIYRPDKPVPPGQSPGAGLWVVGVTSPVKVSSGPR